VVTEHMTKILRDVENFLDAAIVLVAPNGIITFYSDHASEIFELTGVFDPQNLSFTDIVDYAAKRGDFGPGDPAQFANLFLQNLETSLIEPFQTYLTMPTGKVLRVIIQKSPDGAITLTALDISEQRRKENVLEMALDIGLAGYMLYDSANESFTLESRYLKGLLTPDEIQTLEQSGPALLIHKDDQIPAHIMWRAALKTGEKHSGRDRVVTEKQGTRWCRFVVMPENGDTQSTRFMCFFSDISETVEQQENLNKAKQLAEETLRSKEDFLARLSHEVRTPMNAVIGISDALIHHHADEQINPKLELIQNSANSILKMLDETLTHSRLDSETFALDPKPDSPGTIVKNICALWEQQALKQIAERMGGSISVRSEIGKGSIFALTVPITLPSEDALHNAAASTENKIKEALMPPPATSHETSVSSTPLLMRDLAPTSLAMATEAALQTAGDPEAPESSAPENSASENLEPEDLGKRSLEATPSSRSTPPVLQRPPAQPPISASEPTLGSETQRIAASVSTASRSVTPALSNPPITSSVLAAAEKSYAAPKSKPPNPQKRAIVINETSASLVDQMLVDAEPNTAYSHLKVLVVDDNSTNHLVIRSLLGSVVSEIHLASNGAEALETLDNTHVDVVLMDIHMPVMDGIECTLAIRSSEKSWRDVLIIALTADPQYQQKKLCLNIGMDEALAKPVRLNDLLSAIDTVLLKAAAWPIGAYQAERSIRR